MPYLNGAKLTEDKSLAELGYKKPIIKRDGTTAYPTSAAAPVIRLANGAIILLTASTGTIDDKTIVLGISFTMDIDGPKGRNMYGKDVFTVVIPFATNSRLFFNQSFVHKADNSFILSDNPREELLDDCKTIGKWCGALIQKDGWQIKDDYPW